MEKQRNNSAAPEAVPNGKRRLLSLVILAVVVLGAAAAGLAWFHELRTTLTTDNAKVSGDLVDIGARTGGRLEKVLVKEEDYVQQGQVLAELDNDQYRAELDQARANLELAQANYAKLPEDLKSMQASVEKAREGLVAAQAQVKAAEIAREDARRILEENELLYEAGAIAKETLESSRSRYRTAEASLDAARANAVSAQAVLQDAEAKWEGMRKTSAIICQAQLKQAQAAYNKAKLNYDHTVIKAPVNGTVLRVAAQAGETVSTGQTILTIADLKSTWIAANIEEKKLERIRIGQKVDVKIDAYPGRLLPGKVTSIGGATQSVFSLIPTENTSGNFTKVTQRVPVKINVDHRGILLRPGMSAVIKIYTGK